MQESTLDENGNELVPVLSEPSPFINVEDVVIVEFSFRSPVTGVVKHIPQATGDAWIIVDGSGTSIYIQQYAMMARISQNG